MAGMRIRTGDRPWPDGKGAMVATGFGPAVSTRGAVACGVELGDGVAAGSCADCVGRARVGVAGRAVAVGVQVGAGVGLTGAVAAGALPQAANIAIKP